MLATAEAYFLAWSESRWADAAAMVIEPATDFVEVHERWGGDLGVTDAVFTVMTDAVFPSEAHVEFSADLVLAGFGPLSYDGTLRLVRPGDTWLVAWTPATIFPSFDAGDRLVLVRSWPERAAITARDGQALRSQQPVKVIGVVPGQIDDIDALTTSLEALAGIDPAHVRAEIDRPGVQPDWFVPVGSLEPQAHEAVSDELDGLAGLLVRDDTQRSGPPPPFADQILGGTGTMTVELLDSLGPPYGPFDTVGRSGLELAFEQELAGAPAQEIRHINKFGRVVSVLADTTAVAPSPIITTIDVDVQEAVETAIASVELPAAMVVIDVASGDVLAAVSRPLSSGFNRSLTGLYPPGSTFKIVTATALLEAGVGPTENVPCPATVVIEGRTFRNSNSVNLGALTFRDAFAESCNTSFAGLAAERLAPGDLAAVAGRFGYETTVGVPLGAVVGDFPTPPDTAGRAAAAIGQGSVLTSPLHQASIAAAVASGAWRAPRLLTRHAPAEPIPLDPDVAQTLRTFMRSVVTDGTGQAANLPDERVWGKTGSAEFGPDDDPSTHAWFVGFWGDLAFAVVVEGGGSGGRVAAPIAADFIRLMAVGA